MNKKHWLCLQAILLTSLMLILLGMNLPTHGLSLVTSQPAAVDDTPAHTTQTSSMSLDTPTQVVTNTQSWIIWEMASAPQSLHLAGDTLWVGSHQGGLYEWHTSLGYQNYYTGTTGQDIISLASLADGNTLLAASGDGLLLGDDAFSNITPAADALAWDVAVAGDGQAFWLATLGDGVFHSQNNAWTNHTTTDGLPFNDVYAVALDASGNPWLGTLGYGTAYFDGSNWLRYTLPVSLSHPITPSLRVANDAVSDIAVDNQNNKWFATDGSGVVVLDNDNSNWTVYDTETSGLPDNFVYAVALDGDTRWFGTLGGGAASLDTTTGDWQVFDTGNSPLPDDDVLAIAIDAHGGQWFAAYDAGLTYHGPLPETAPIFALNPFDTPSYVPGTAKAYNIWLDPDTYIWHLAWSGDRNAHEFSGTVVADGPITLVETLDFEEGDSATVEDNVLTIQAAETSGEDVVRFTLDRAATELTFALQIDGAYYPFNMQIGEDGDVPPTAPFRLAAPQPQAPEVVLNAAQTITEGQSVYLKGSFTDADSFIGHEINWDLGNGDTMTDTLSVSARYEEDGVYPVTLTITDVHGAVGQAQATVTVENAAPEVYLYTDVYYPETETPITWYGDVYDPGIHDSHTTLWDFGDGISAADSLTVTHVYTVPGTYTVTLTVTDDDGGIGVAQDTLVVYAINHDPTAVDDTVTTDEDTAVLIPVLDNDSDLDGDALTVISTTLPVSGTAVLNLDNTITYTPTLNIHGVDSFSYTIDDGRDGFNTAVVTVTIQPVNDAPSAVDDSAVTDEDTAVTVAVLTNDSDIDGDDLSVSSVTQPGNGQVAINPDGTVTYTPDADFNSGDSADGTDSFTYAASDGQGAATTATVVVTVNPVNDAPTAVDDPVTTSEDTAVIVDVLTNDSEVDGDALALENITQPTNGIAAVNLDGTVTYTPTVNYHGSDSFTYTVNDGNGAVSAAAVLLTVTPMNDVPTTADDTAVTAEDTAAIISVLANDLDVDGDALTVTAVTTPTNGVVFINQDNSLTYTPATNYAGPDSFTYTVSDGNGGMDTSTVSVTVTAVNDAPQAIDDESATAEETAVTVDVLANDGDVDGDSLAIEGVGLPGHGSVVVNLDNTITYTPTVNYVGSDSFIYTVNDGNGSTATAMVTITVSNENDNPVAVDDNITTDEDTAVTIAALANDSDVDGDTLTIDSVTEPAHGTAIINPDNTITYTPNGNYHGTDGFSYTIHDGNGGAATAVVSITVTPVNDAPVAADDTATTNEDTAVTIPVLDNDNDVDGDMLAVTVTTTPTLGIAVVNPDNSVTYTPDADVHGNDSFTYAVHDGAGGTSTAVVTLNVLPVNDVPIVVNDNGSTDEDTAVTLAVLANDADVDGDILAVQSVSQPENGTVAINLDNSLTYTPTADYHGADTFTYTVVDGNGGTATADVTVAVNPVNDAPIAADDAAVTAEDMAFTIPVLANDTDIDGDLLQVTSVTTPTHGLVTVNPDNSLTYVPEIDFNGQDSFAYTISDGHSAMDTATVVITVTAVNDAPVAVDDAVITDEDTAVIILVLANDSDVDGDTLLIDNVTQPVTGTVVVNPDNTVTYTPAADFSGADSFSYTINDGQGAENTAVVTVNVTSVNDNPEAVDDTATTNEDTAVTITVLANDSDSDGDELAVVNITPAAAGTAVVNPDNSITYSPDADANGSDSFSYTISDGQGGAATAVVHVTITPVNDPPSAAADTAATDENTAVTIDVLANDHDSDGDALSVTDVTQPAHGAVLINEDDSLTYSPDPGFSGTDTLVYTVSDGYGGVDTAVVVVDVLPVAASCDLYPIALHADTLIGAQPGDILPDIFNGTQSGNFGWLTWTGANGVPTLVASLTQPGNSHTYINPNNPNDHSISIGDWIEGKPGLSNAKKVRNALDELMNLDIVVPVWEATQGNGANTVYQVSGFATVRILGYRLPGQDRITVQFLGMASCSSE